MSDSGAKVLLVEDDRFLRKAADATLRQAGFRVVLAIDGEEALRQARAEHPDIILLDVIMPKLQGFEVLRELKADATTKDIPVIVLSNLGQESDTVRAMEAGAVEYVVKASLSLQELVKKVQDTLSKARG